ncbi:AraC-like DNA-binding protein [Xanthomonas sacchari]|uniref:AraC family transcriptional regulator n=1 Tax=unclassified Xanthomonas TaxID=2643310 RepID=UPI0013720E01|nr:MULTISPECIES: AraC family transcriptional regulator [unclassified Xanthomonas]MBB6368437.1 AraC-like DNA-binding protein [Xanthomonas sp. F10]MXV33081.1 AraC family transcriptional regulator [Xanthomonas sp. LMG 8989]
MKTRQFTLLRCRREGVEAVAADTARVFGRHTHEQFGVGLIARGAQKSASGRGVVEAGAGDIITVNPGEVHDGTPIGDGGRSWRMLYLDPVTVDDLVSDVAEGRTASAFEFTAPAIRDPRLAILFRRLFQAMTCRDAGQDGLEADETLLLFLGSLLRPRSEGRPSVPAAIASARALIDDDPVSPVTLTTLTTLAREAGLSRYQFLRSFARATGLTPHAYLMQRRIHRARRLIGRGMRLADVAAASGFSDQSHMTRLFVRSFGMAPGTYAKALGSA